MPPYTSNLQQLEDAVAQLPDAEFTAFAHWFEEFLADRWDRQIEEDFLAGRLDKLIQEANEDFNAGRCTLSVAASAQRVT